MIFLAAGALLCGTEVTQYLAAQGCDLVHRRRSLVPPTVDCVLGRGNAGKHMTSHLQHVQLVDRVGLAYLRRHWRLRESVKQVHGHGRAWSE